MVVRVQVPSPRLPGTDASDTPASPGSGRPRLAHYKGFANGLDFRDPGTAAELGKAVGLLDVMDVVVWDGDGYNPDSFSHLIPLLAPAVKLVAVRTTGHGARGTAITIVIGHCCFRYCIRPVSTVSTVAMTDQITQPSPHVGQHRPPG